MRRRPLGMFIDRQRCIECGLCDVFAPGTFERTDLIPINEATLEAMAACPTGAILWHEVGAITWEEQEEPRA